MIQRHGAVMRVAQSHVHVGDALGLRQLDARSRGVEGVPQSHQVGPLFQSAGQ